MVLVSEGRMKWLGYWICSCSLIHSYLKKPGTIFFLKTQRVFYSNYNSITEDVSHLDVGNHDKLMQMEVRF